MRYTTVNDRRYAGRPVRGKQVLASRTHDCGSFVVVPLSRVSTAEALKAIHLAMSLNTVLSMSIGTRLSGIL